MKKLIIVTLLLLTASIYSLNNELTMEAIEVEEKDSSQDLIPGIYIKSNIKEITIIANGKKYRKETLFLTELPPGNYNFRFSKPGYVTSNLWIEYEEDKHIVVDVTLEREYGFISIDSKMDSYEIYLDGEIVQENEKLPTGAYNLKLRSFGYSEENVFINILPNSTALLEYNPEEVEFQIVSVTTDKEMINPLAVEAFSLLRLGISVNGPGEAEVQYLNKDNELLFSKRVDFTTWETSIDFNGYTNGEKLENGSYKVRVLGDKTTVTKEFRIDDTLFISKNNMVFTKTGDYYDVSVKQTGFSLNRNFLLEETKVNINHRVYNYGASLFGDLTLSLFELTSILSLEGGISKCFDFNRVKAAPNLSYIFNLNTFESSSSTYHNIKMVLPITFTYNNINLTLSPGTKYNFNSNDLLKIGSGGIEYDNQKISTGISTTVETLDFTEYTYLFGGEFHYLLKGSQSYIGLVITSDIDLNISTGIAVNLLY